jgi:hypothetical protein
MFGWFRRARGPRSATAAEKELIRSSFDRIINRVCEAPLPNRTIFSITLALADGQHADKFGGDAGFVSAPEQAQREELRRVLERERADEEKLIPGAQLSALAWRAHGHRLMAIMSGDQRLLAHIKERIKFPIEYGLKAVLEIDAQKKGAGK